MYNGNTNLRGPNQKITMSKQRIAEYIRCKEDILYFAENYFHIVDIDKGKHKIKLREYQKRMVKAFHKPTEGKRHVVMLSSRQVGKCVCKDTKIKIKNKKTGKIEEIDIETFFEIIKNNNNNIEIKNKKFIESIEIDDWEVETDSGWEDITHIHKTILFNIWTIKTKDYELKCADEHIVIDYKNEQVYVKDLKLGDLIKTKKGIQKITYIEESKEEDNMYDVTVRSNNHTLYTNGILSHNTTVAIVYLTHYALFNEDKNIAILADKEKTANEILRRIKLAIQEFPLWLQQGISETNGGWNKGMVGFENGVRFLAGSTSSTAMKGESISLLYLDEFGFVPDNVADEFMRSVYPTVTSSQKAKIIICSTPNGLNHFYHIWRGAIEKDPEKQNNFMAVKINWNEIEGRDKKWKEGIIRDIGAQGFAQEYACKFLGSSSTLIDADILERLSIKDPIELKLGDRFNIYEPPDPKAFYIIGVDSAKGTGKDFSVIQVLKIVHEHDIQQVAMYSNNLIDAMDFAEVCISVSEYYNGAYMLIENNEIGACVADTIWFQFEYDKILNIDKKGIGIRSTKTSKLAGCVLLKKYMDAGWISIIDRTTIYELSRFEELRPNIFSAPRGTNDDSVMALIWALYFVNTVYFDGKTGGVKTIDEKFKLSLEDQQDDVPIMFYQNDEQLEEGWGYREDGRDYNDDDIGIF